MTASPRVKPRPYDGSRRRSASAARRQRVLDAARALLVERGYVGTTMAAIAERADVNVDTVYTLAGGKPKLFALLLETSLTGGDVPVPVAQRGYVKAIQAQPDARIKLQLYSQAVADFMCRLAPLLHVVAGARESDPGLTRQWDALMQRRARNLSLLIDDLLTAGALRPGLDRSRAADTVAAVASVETYVLLVERRRWSADDYRDWLADALSRLLLA